MDRIYSNGANQYIPPHNPSFQYQFGVSTTSFCTPQYSLGRQQNNTGAGYTAPGAVYNNSNHFVKSQSVDNSERRLPTRPVHQQDQPSFSQTESTANFEHIFFKAPEEKVRFWCHERESYCATLQDHNNCVNPSLDTCDIDSGVTDGVEYLSITPTDSVISSRTLLPKLGDNSSACSSILTRICDSSNLELEDDLLALELPASIGDASPSDNSSATLLAVSQAPYDYSGGCGETIIKPESPLCEQTVQEELIDQEILQISNQIAGLYRKLSQLALDKENIRRSSPKAAIEDLGKENNIGLVYPVHQSSTPALLLHQNQPNQHHQGQLQERSNYEPFRAHVSITTMSKTGSANGKRKVKRRSYQATFEEPQLTGAHSVKEIKNEPKSNGTRSESGTPTKALPAVGKRRPEEGIHSKKDGFGYAGRGAAPGGDWRCEYCRTDTTPMKRLGPSGQKTLCNRCGVAWKQGRVMRDNPPPLIFNKYGRPPIKTKNYNGEESTDAISEQEALHSEKQHHYITEDIVKREREVNEQQMRLQDQESANASAKANNRIELQMKSAQRKMQSPVASLHNSNSNSGGGGSGNGKLPLPLSSPTTTAKVIHNAKSVENNGREERSRGKEILTTQNAREYPRNESNGKAAHYERRGKGKVVSNLANGVPRKISFTQLKAVNATQLSQRSNDNATDTDQVADSQRSSVAPQSQSQRSFAAAAALTGVREKIANFIATMPPQLQERVMTRVGKFLYTQNPALLAETSPGDEIELDLQQLDDRTAQMVWGVINHQRGTFETDDSELESEPPSQTWHSMVGKSLLGNASDSDKLEDDIDEDQANQERGWENIYTRNL